LFGLGLLITGCIGNRDTDIVCPKYDYTGAATPIPTLPVFLRGAWPIPFSRISLDCYSESLKQGYPVDGRGVGVGIIISAIDTNLLVTPEVDEVARVELYVDGHLIDKTNFLAVDLGVELVSFDEIAPTPTYTGRSSSFSLSWTPDLSVGDHEAKIVIERDNGDLLEYTWRFTIVD
jgi:hypothetical protein